MAAQGIDRAKKGTRRPERAGASAPVDPRLAELVRFLARAAAEADYQAYRRKARKSPS